MAAIARCSPALSPHVASFYPSRSSNRPATIGYYLPVTMNGDEWRFMLASCGFDLAGNGGVDDDKRLERLVCVQLARRCLLCRVAARSAPTKSDSRNDKVRLAGLTDLWHDWPPKSLGLLLLRAAAADADADASKANTLTCLRAFAHTRLEISRGKPLSTVLAEDIELRPDKKMAAGGGGWSAG
jgi:hypothetical protein